MVLTALLPFYNFTWVVGLFWTLWNKSKWLKLFFYLLYCPQIKGSIKGVNLGEVMEK